MRIGLVRVSKLTVNLTTASPRKPRLPTTNMPTATMHDSAYYYYYKLLTIEAEA